MCSAQQRDRPDSCIWCSRPAYYSVPRLLFALFYYFSTIILSIILIISKDVTVIWVSIHCINEPLWQERKQDIMIRRQPRSICPVPWRMRLRMPCSIGSLDVFQPAHDWTKRIAQCSDRLGDLGGESARWSCHTWIDLSEQSTVIIDLSQAVRKNNEHNDNNHE